MTCVYSGESHLYQIQQLSMLDNAQRKHTKFSNLKENKNWDKIFICS